MIEWRIRNYMRLQQLIEFYYYQINQTKRMQTSRSKVFLQTGERSDRRQKQMYSSSRSRFYSPDSRSTSSDLSQTKGYDITVSTIVSIINQLKQQNEYLSKQKNAINKQMGQLDALTNVLVDENEALRKHYHQRTIDVGQLVKSISINTQHNMQDSQHLLHAYYQHNSLLAKQINSINQTYQQKEKNIFDLESQLNQFAKSNSVNQINLKKAEARSQQTAKNFKKQKLNKTLLDLQNLQRQVANLVVQVHKVKKNNIPLVKLLQKQRFEIQTDRPIFKNGVINTIKGMKSLKQEIQKIKHDCGKLKIKYEGINSNNQIILAKIKFYQSQNQQRNRKLKSIAQNFKRIEQKKRISIQQIKSLSNKRQNLLKSEHELDKQLQFYQQNKVKNLTAFQMKKKQIQKQNQLKIIQVKQNLEQISKNQMVQLESLGRIKNQNNSNIGNLKFQLQKLKQKAKQIQNGLKQNLIKPRYTNLSNKSQIDVNQT